MNTTRSTAPGMRLVAAALGATIATAGLGLCALPALADVAASPDATVESQPADPAAETATDPASSPETTAADSGQPSDQAPAPSTIAVSALTAEQAADPSYAGAQADASAPTVSVELSNDVDGAAQLYDAIDALRADAGLSPLVRDAGLEADAYQRAAESSLLEANVRPNGSLFSTVDASARIDAEILVSADAAGPTDAASALSALTADQQALLTSGTATNVGVALVTDASGNACWAIEVASDGAEGGSSTAAGGAATYRIAVSSGNVQLGTIGGDISVEAGAAQTAALPATVSGQIAVGAGTASFTTTEAALDASSLTWSSSDPAVATVDANGTVTGVGSGSCTVSAEGAAGQFSFNVSVTGGEPAASTVDLADCTIAGMLATYEATGEPVAPAFTVIDADNNTIDPSQYTYAFTDNVEPGTATLTVTAAEGATAVTGSATRTFEIVAPAPIQVAMPNVAGSSVEDATAALEAAGLSVASATEGDPAPDAASQGLVYATDPAAETLVDVGTPVALSYYAAPVAQTEEPADPAGTEEPSETEGEAAGEGATQETPGEEGTEADDAQQTETEMGEGGQTGETGEEADGEGEDGEGAEKDPVATDLAAAGYTIGEISPQTFAGSAVEPSVAVNGPTALVLGQDYTISFSDNAAPGTATATVTGTGAYTGTLTATFQILGDISQAAVSGLDNQVYTGAALTPVATVKFGDKTLTAGTDYDVAYANNVNAGTATVTITGKGIYSGTLTVNFTITAKSIKGSEISPIASATYTGSAITPQVTVTDGTTVLANGTDYTVSYESNVNAGTAHVVVTGTGNYRDSIDTTFVIAPIEMNRATIVMPNMSYTGSALTPHPVSVTVDGITLVEGTDYDVVGYSNNTNVGNATATITGKGNFTGTVTANWKVVQQSSAETGTTETLPKTGDSTNIVAMAIGAVVGVALIGVAAALIVHRVRANKRDGR